MLQHIRQVCKNKRTLKDPNISRCVHSYIQQKKTLNPHLSWRQLYISWQQDVGFVMLANGDMHDVTEIVFRTLYYRFLEQDTLKATSSADEEHAADTGAFCALHSRVGANRVRHDI